MRTVSRPGHRRNTKIILGIKEWQELRRAFERLYSTLSAQPTSIQDFLGHDDYLLVTRWGALLAGKEPPTEKELFSTGEEGEEGVTEDNA